MGSPSRVQVPTDFIRGFWELLHDEADVFNLRTELGNHIYTTISWFLIHTRYSARDAQLSFQVLRHPTQNLYIVSKFV